MNDQHQKQPFKILHSLFNHEAPPPQKLVEVVHSLQKEIDTL